MVNVFRGQENAGRFQFLLKAAQPVEAAAPGQSVAQIGDFSVSQFEQVTGNLAAALYETLTPVRVRLPYQQGQLIALFHELGQVDFVEHGRKGVLMQGRVPGRLAAQFQPWQVKPGEKETEETEHVQMDQ